MHVYGSGPWVDLVDFELWVDYGQEICASCSAWTTQLPITISPFIFNTFLPGIYWFRKTNNLPTRVKNPGCSSGSGAGRWPSIPSEGCVNVCMWVGWVVWGGGWGGWEGGWAGQVDRFPSRLRDVWTCACHRQAGFCKTGKKGSTVLKQPTMDDGWNTGWDSQLKTISRKIPKCE